MDNNPTSKDLPNSSTNYHEELNKLHLMIFKSDIDDRNSFDIELNNISLKFRKKRFPLMIRLFEITMKNADNVHSDQYYQNIVVIKKILDWQPEFRQFVMRMHHRMLANILHGVSKTRFKIDSTEDLQHFLNDWTSLGLQICKKETIIAYLQKKIILKSFNKKKAAILRNLNSLLTITTEPDLEIQKPTEISVEMVIKVISNFIIDSRGKRVHYNTLDNYFNFLLAQIYPINDDTKPKPYLDEKVSILDDIKTEEGNKEYLYQQLMDAAGQAREIGDFLEFAGQNNFLHGQRLLQNKNQMGALVKLSISEMAFDAAGGHKITEPSYMTLLARSYKYEAKAYTFRKRGHYVKYSINLLKASQAINDYDYIEEMKKRSVNLRILGEYNSCLNYVFEKNFRRAGDKLDQLRKLVENPYHTDIIKKEKWMKKIQNIENELRKSNRSYHHR